MRKCGYCGELVTQSGLVINGSLWHLACFICAACEQPIGKASYFEHEGLVFHSGCYHLRFSPRCAGCDQIILGTSTKALGKNWHPEHFTCAVCKEPFARKSYYEREGHAYCERDYHEGFSPRCAGCEKPITGRYIKALGKLWHTEHFVCAMCRKPFRDKGHFEKDEQVYCEKDYIEKFSLRCDICNVAMSGQYMLGQWGERYCSRHERKLHHCFSCYRLVCDRLTGGGARYSDGRHMCNLCRTHCVTDISEGERLLIPVQRKLVELGLGLGESVLPLRLPMGDELKRLNHKAHGNEPVGMARSRATVRDGRIITRDIEEILVIYGITREHFQAIAAHELMHAWLFLNGYDHLPSVVEEGLCELASYLWLVDQSSPQARHHLKLLEGRDDPIYGEGLSKARSALHGHTLADLLKYVRQYSALPSSNPNFSCN